MNKKQLKVPDPNFNPLITQLIFKIEKFTDEELTALEQAIAFAKAKRN